MTFLLTFALGLLGIVAAAAVLRVALADGSRPAGFAGAVAVAAVALLAASGLVNAGKTVRLLFDKHERWEGLSRQDAIDGPSTGAAVDPAFVRMAKPHLLRGDTFFISRKAGDITRMWLMYRLAPNIAEDRPEDADWIIYWQEPDPFRTHQIRVEDILVHLKWGPDVGLIKRRRAS